jgi:hypothetical protein
MNRISIAHLAAAILCVGLLTTAGANASPPVTFTGSCTVNEDGKLDGNCLTYRPPYHICNISPSSDCAAGRRARVVNSVPCGVSSAKVDPKKVCHD